MKLTDLIDVVSKVSPIIGTALAGPAGGLVGTLIANTFGADDKNPDDILKKLQADPEAQFKLKQLELQHQEALQQIEAQKYIAELNDVANARNRQILTNDNVPTILSIGFLIIYAILQFYAIYSPGGQDDVISARVQDILMMIIGYYFGSSHKENNNAVEKR